MEFFSKLQSLKSNRGALAKLRKGGIDGISVIGSVLPRDWQRDWYLLIAECWARNPVSGGRLAIMCKMAKITDNRFKVLVQSDREELPERLRSILRIIEQKGYGVNWQDLLNDVLFWGERTQTNWALDFWGR